jgi:hypothetical protein
MTDCRTGVLKIDKDIFVDNSWIVGYARTIIQICRGRGLRVIHIKMCPSRRKGLHFYIAVRPAIDAHQANYLQWLLGDDCQRVDFNRARIESDLTEWNKLFEVPERRLRTIYRCRDETPARPLGNFSLARSHGHGIGEIPDKTSQRR